MAKLENCTSLAQYILVTLLLVFAQVQARDHAWKDRQSRSDAHETKLVLQHSSWRHPWRDSSIAGQLQRQVAAAGSRRIDAESRAEIFRRTHQGKTYRGAPHQRAAIKSTIRSRQEMRALMNFRAGISDADISTFMDWNTNDSTPCDWTGVSCSRSRRKPHVTELKLPSHQLVGNVNSALFALSKLDFLEKVDLSDNNFTSFISGAALVNFSSLSHLNLSYNQVSGEIPEQVGELSNLQSLVLAENDLSGQIPPSISNCTMLRVLNLESNLLVSRIPDAFGRLTSLEELFLGTSTPPIVSAATPVQKNKILGPIPSSLGNCSSLATFSLTINPDLGGEIPSAFSQLRNLRSLALFECGLEGALPRWMSNLTHLIEIILGGNRLHGTIPTEFGRLHNLSMLALEGNYLTGNIPSELGNCTSLITLDVQHNLLQGAIPSDLQNCRLLQFLSLGFNPLMDPSPIPQWIGSMGQLEDLLLPNMNFVGEIPNELGRLSKLRLLNIIGNSLTGPIPYALSNCTLLENFGLEGNNLTGRIPSEIGLLAKLSVLDVSSNFLSGSIPNSFTNLTQLGFFQVASNALDGTIDRQWGRLSLLQGFYAWGNHFVGSIPETLSNCSHLHTIDVHHNNLTGEIPASFGNLSNLVTLSVSSNSINGKVPADLGRCSSLSNLDLEACKFEGPLPPDLGGLPFLTNVYLSNNDFGGTIEESFSNFTQLVQLDLSYNRFSGRIPGEVLSRMTELTLINFSHNLLSGSLFEDWSSLNGIRTIVISGNEISGQLPNFTNLKSLQMLDVSSNNFSGELPQSLASLPDLVFFNASFNNFVGPIPETGAFESNITAASFLGNPGLCGGVLGPSRPCQRNASESRSTGHCEGFRCAEKWVPTTVGGATCILFVAAVVMRWRVTTKALKEIEKRESVEVVVNFSPNLPKFAAKEILALIRAGGNDTGTGSRSVVYRGSVPGFGVIIIKTFAIHEDEGTESLEFDCWRSFIEREAITQASLRHRNILKVLRFYSNVAFRALLLEYMPRGSLEKHLYPIASVRRGGEILDQSCQLPWSVRFGIAVDVADGMKYIHHDLQEPLIHGDLKPSNIFLDQDMVAKVAGFGISKLVNLHRGGDPGEATLSSVRGTVGYMPPEYALVTTVSTRGDVFSYGVLLLEMLSGTSPTNTPFDRDFRVWNLQRFHASPTQMLDPILQQEGRMDALKTSQMLLLAKVGFFCTRGDPQSRPSMKDVLSMLIQVQEVGVDKIPSKTDQRLEAEDHKVESSNGVSAWENDDPNGVAFPSISN